MRHEDFTFQKLTAVQFAGLVLKLQERIKDMPYEIETLQFYADNGNPIVGGWSHIVIASPSTGTSGAGLLIEMAMLYAGIPERALYEIQNSC